MSLMVSRMHRSSPCRADSMASGRLDLRSSLVTASEPRQSVDSREIVVEVEAADFETLSGVAEVEAGVTGAAPDPEGGAGVCALADWLPGVA